MVLMLACWLGSAVPYAFAQNVPPPPPGDLFSPGPPGPPPGRPPGPPPAPRSWQSLSPAERDVLAPLADKWDSLPPQRQARMLERAQQWKTLPPEQRQAIRQRIDQWQKMTPEQREQASENSKRFQQLPPEQREQLHAAFQHFQQLPPDQREQLLRQWHEEMRNAPRPGMVLVEVAAGRRTRRSSEPKTPPWRGFSYSPAGNGLLALDHPILGNAVRHCASRSSWRSARR